MVPDPAVVETDLHGAHVARRLYRRLEARGCGRRRSRPRRAGRARSRASTRSGSPSCQPWVNGGALGRSAGSPSAPPVSTHLWMRAISASVSRRSPANVALAGLGRPGRHDSLPRHGRDLPGPRPHVSEAQEAERSGLARPMAGRAAREHDGCDVLVEGDLPRRSLLAVGGGVRGRDEREGGQGRRERPHGTPAMKQPTAGAVSRGTGRPDRIAAQRVLQVVHGGLGAHPAQGDVAVVDATAIGQAGPARGGNEHRRLRGHASPRRLQKRRLRGEERDPGQLVVPQVAANRLRVRRR